MFRPAKKGEFSIDICQYSKDHWPSICLLAIISVVQAAATLDDDNPIVVNAISMSVLLFVFYYAVMLYTDEDHARVSHERAIEQAASPGLRR